jgi:hypothetical protein
MTRTTVNRIALGTLIVVAAAGGVAWSLRNGPAEKPPEPAPPMAPEKAPTPTPGAATSVVMRIPDKKGVPPEQLLRFPNGETAAPLNGIENPATCVWGTDVPWSPIVRRELNNGLEWYVHADGTYTTTTKVWRSDTQRMEPVTLCLHPTTPAPLNGDDGKGTGGEPKK